MNNVQQENSYLTAHIELSPRTHRDVVSMLRAVASVYLTGLYDHEKYPHTLLVDLDKQAAARQAINDSCLLSKKV
jgi:hypothetical protein